MTPTRPARSQPAPVRGPALRRAAPLLLALLGAFALVPSTEAQERKGKCTGEPPDSAWFAAGPVYRDCEVDRKADLRGGAPRLGFPSGDLVPRKECYRASLDFVVDERGQPEMQTVRPVPGNDRELEDAMRAVLPSLQYRPAEREGVAVRQLVVYATKVAVSVTATRSGGQPSPISSRRPRC